MIPTANIMLNYILKEPKHESFYKKYASKKFLKVCSRFCSPAPYLTSPIGQRIRTRVGVGTLAARWTSSTRGGPLCPERGDPSSESQGDCRRCGCRRAVNFPRTTLALFVPSFIFLTSSQCVHDVISGQPPSSPSNAPQTFVSAGFSLRFVDVLSSRLG